MVCEAEVLTPINLKPADREMDHRSHIRATNLEIVLCMTL
jgi:hypothetical protein